MAKVKKVKKVFKNEHNENGIKFSITRKKGNIESSYTVIVVEGIKPDAVYSAQILYNQQSQYCYSSDDLAKYLAKYDAIERKKFNSLLKVSEISYYVIENTWLKKNGGFGWGNGYIALPEAHPLYGCHYDHVNRFIKVHGGFTYSELKNGMWVLGFDTCHYEDDLVKWSKEAVEKETERVFEDLKNYVGFKRHEAFIDSLKSVLLHYDSDGLKAFMMSKGFNENEMSSAEEFMDSLLQHYIGFENL